MRRDLETREYPTTTRRGNEWSSFPSFGDLFQNFFSPAFLGSGTGANVPSLDLTESSESYEVVVDVPGYTMDQINVQFADNVLTLSGERPEKVSERTEGGKGKTEGNGRCHIMERSWGSFSRSIKFPVPVDAGNVKASMRNGVLTITVPKGAAARAHKIKITES